MAEINLILLARLFLLCGLALAQDEISICRKEKISTPNSGITDRHLLLVHVSSADGKDFQSQLAKFSKAAEYAIDAGLALDCQYRQIVDNSAELLRDHLPVGYLKVAGQTISWPLLFQDGSITGADLLERLSEQPATVQELDDATFEGLTQASTGSTTGHWLVVFLDPADRQLSQKTSLLWGLAQTLRRSHVNVARVLLGEATRDTAERFSLQEGGDKEAAVLLRSGGFYPIPHRVADWNLIVAFCAKGFNNHKRLAVPPPPSPFDHAVDAVLAFLMSFNNVWGVSPVFIALSAGALTVAVALALVCICASKGLAKVASKVD